jgi:hypothetical protein
MERSAIQGFYRGKKEPGFRLAPSEPRAFVIPGRRGQRQAKRSFRYPK